MSAGANNRVLLTQSKYWLFTIFDEATINTLTNEDNAKAYWEAIVPSVNYAVWQLEKCPTSDRLHIQGYCELQSVIRGRTAITKLGQGTHIEKRKGTRTQAKEYCSKEETRQAGPWEFGTFTPSQTKTSYKDKCSAIFKLLEEGKTQREIIELYPEVWMRSHRAIEKFITMLHPPRNHQTTLSVIYGPTRSGKSFYAYSKYPQAYWKSADQWWNNYNGDEIVILDEFYGWIKHSDLLRLADAYPLQVQTKGGMVEFTAKHVILISNEPMDGWYNQNIMRHGALKARVSNFIHIPARNVIHEMSINEADEQGLTKTTYNAIDENYRGFIRNI